MGTALGMGAAWISAYASIKELRSRECVALRSSLVIPTVLCRIVGCFRVFSFDDSSAAFLIGTEEKDLAFRLAFAISY
jgi:hypothetical protein